MENFFCSIVFWLVHDRAVLHLRADATVLFDSIVYYFLLVLFIQFFFFFFFIFIAEAFLRIHPLVLVAQDAFRRAMEPAPCSPQLYGPRDQPPPVTSLMV